jgi:hypothetical protein
MYILDFLMKLFDLILKGIDVLTKGKFLKWLRPPKPVIIVTVDNIQYELKEKHEVPTCPSCNRPLDH